METENEIIYLSICMHLVLGSLHVTLIGHIFFVHIDVQMRRNLSHVYALNFIHFHWRHYRRGIMENSSCYDAYGSCTRDVQLNNFLFYEKIEQLINKIMAIYVLNDYVTTELNL